ncbi:MAG: RluA family pseudouridine synthase [Patescibacteria group bacterium]
MRLDIFLREKFPESSRAHWQRKVKNGEVLINGEVVKNAHLELNGDEKVEVIEEKKNEIAGEISSTELPFPVLYEDEYLLVIDKPAGIAVHKPANGKTVIEFLEQARPFAKLVHRLDKDTSGVLVAAKSETVHAKLSAKWKARNVKKTYFALVKGVFEIQKGRIEAPIHRSMKDRTKMAVSGRKGSRDSVTEFEVMETFKNDTSLLRVDLLTGRTHQIRVHLSSIMHPVICDAVYGNEDLNKKFERLFGLKRQFLHSGKLTFTHPETGKEITIKSKLPQDLQEVLDLLKNQN